VQGLFVIQDVRGWWHTLVPVITLNLSLRDATLAGNLSVFLRMTS
jgi:hypothetical protein